ncbi:hypothetical protein [Amycolatopsis nigrescens]|uniref:hypothetical protein n=1 Tax=Amycolatopsis nigrescens TaxID=381445 RepID=UPI0003662512|nr:hypothetical protein [Amycolatopsis nigrescens]
MDFWKTLGVLLRRWYIAVPVLLISLGLAAGVYVSVDTDYESTGTIVLTSSAEGARASSGDDAGAVDLVNPLLAFDGSLNTSAQIIIQTLQDPSIAEQVLGSGGTAKYEVGSGQLTGPFIVVVANARTPDEARGIVTTVLERARAELTERQKALNAPETTFIKASQVVSPTPAEAKTGGKTRFAAVALVLGFVASLGAAYGWESFSDARRRKEPKPEPEPDRPLPPPPEPGAQQPANGHPTVRLRPVSRDQG